MGNCALSKKSQPAALPCQSPTQDKLNMFSSNSTLYSNTKALFQNKWRTALLCLALLPLLSSNAFSLDWGHPLMLSKQGERLRVEIPLTSLSPEEARGLHVNLAPASLYQIRQLADDAASLSAIGTQVKLSQNAKAQDIVVISSDKPLTQSFISLLLEVHWSTGSETKELGLLLETLPPIKPTPDNAIVVNEGDTASSIAQQLAKAPITYEQMLVALLRNNPKSFINQNINRLRADATLKIPSNAQALAISTTEAQQEVKAQNLDFERYRKNLAQKIQNAKVAGPNSAPQSASGLVSPKVQPPSSSNADQLKLSKPGSKSAKSSDQTAKELQAKDTLKETDQVKQNLKELGQLADEKAQSASADSNASAESASNGLLNAPIPSLKSHISSWLQKPLTPIIAAVLFGFLVLLILWKTKNKGDSRQGFEDGQDPLSRPSSIFDLDTPIPNSLRSTPAPLKPLGDTEPLVQNHERAMDGDLRREEKTQDLPDPLPGPSEEGSAMGSLKDHVTIDFDLELPEVEETPPPTLNETLTPETTAFDSNSTTPPLSASNPDAQENPLQVRFDLAQELWQVGQHHTARAIVEEVVNQASGALLEQCQAWLNERQ
jgi:FimV-like protein